ncbi:MAG: UbiA family prenyltransferase [Planctomycetota bacterium]
MIRAWLELCRVSNVPTVWSNVLHGLGVGLLVRVVEPVREIAGEQGAPPFTWADAGGGLDQGFVLMAAMSLLYVGGMVLNDACDARIDADERPGRPIPSGRVSRRSAWVGAAGLLTVGWLLTLLYRPAVGVSAGALVGLIVAYNLLHRWRVAGLLLMPLCRAGVVVSAALAVGWGVPLDGGAARRIALSAAAVAGYTLAVTLLAWSEAKRPRLAAWVGVMIAAMPAVDAVYLTAFGMGPLAVVCLGCGVLAYVGQRWIRGS